MCGRYSLFTPRADLEERFGAQFVADFDPRYNAAPGQALPVVTDDAPGEIRRVEWGLVPTWADDDSGGLINARAETLAEKPSFRDAYRREGWVEGDGGDAGAEKDGGDGGTNGDGEGDEPTAGRCLVLADGFYEWVDDEDAGRKQPYRVAFEDDRPFAMAGLWTRWEPETRQTGLGAFGGGTGEETDGDGAKTTFTVVTTEPNDLVADLHHRMAAILDPDDERRWLTEADPRDALGPHPADEMRAYPVSTAVNSPATDDPSLVEPI